MQKLYCYVDETGQDTYGKDFYVIVIIVDNNDIETVRKSLDDIEIKSGKGMSKWGRSSISKREAYISNISKLLAETKSKSYFSSFHNTKEYIALTAFTLVQAIITYSKDTIPECVIIIDGLSDKDQAKVLKVIKAFKIRYKKIRGPKDESEPVLRLADSLAGLVRDNEEEKEYAKLLLSKLQRRTLIEQIKK